ncbi:MAG: hypothetical protein QXW98_05850 [Candidatus Caldarchaeum sp.]
MDFQSLIEAMARRVPPELSLYIPDALRDAQIAVNRDLHVAETHKVVFLPTFVAGRPKHPMLPEDLIAIDRIDAYAVVHNTVKNGGFDSDDGWELDTGWAILNSQAVFSGTFSGRIRQRTDPSELTPHLVEIEVVDITGELVVNYGTVLDTQGPIKTKGYHHRAFIPSLGQELSVTATGTQASIESVACYLLSPMNLVLRASIQSFLCEVLYRTPAVLKVSYWADLGLADGVNEVETPLTRNYSDLIMAKACALVFEAGRDVAARDTWEVRYRALLDVVNRAYWNTRKAGERRYKSPYVV